MYIRKAASPTPCESLWEALGLGEKVLKKPFHIAAVGSGFAEIKRDHVILLVGFAERPEEIDRKRAEAAKQRAGAFCSAAAHDSYAASGKGRRTHRQGGGCD